eukprot:33530-Chlamydomonas_euryale.AAC.1
MTRPRYSLSSPPRALSTPAAAARVAAQAAVARRRLRRPTSPGSTQQSWHGAPLTRLAPGGRQSRGRDRAPAHGHHGRTRHRRRRHSGRARQSRHRPRGR